MAQDGGPDLGEEASAWADAVPASGAVPGDAVRAGAVLEGVGPEDGVLEDGVPEGVDSGDAVPADAARGDEAPVAAAQAVGVLAAAAREVVVLEVSELVAVGPAVWVPVAVDRPRPRAADRPLRARRLLRAAARKTSPTVRPLLSGSPEQASQRRCAARPRRPGQERRPTRWVGRSVTRAGGTPPRESDG